MSAIPAEFSPTRSNASWPILAGGLSAGVLDISAACINSGFNGRSPMFVLQSVASGVLGSASYKGGLKSAALGLALHFLIAFVACTVFYLASRKIKVLVRRPVVFGILYGIVVYMFMYLVVLPITFRRGFSQPLSAIAIGLTIHMLCVGLPISLAVRHYSK